MYKDLYELGRSCTMKSMPELSTSKFKLFPPHIEANKSSTYTLETLAQNSYSHSLFHRIISYML